jgi:hypothetical protein
MCPIPYLHMDGTELAEKSLADMIEERAEYYRWKAQNCLEQADHARDVWMKDHLRMLADKWFEMADSLTHESSSSEASSRYLW